MKWLLSFNKFFVLASSILLFSFGSILSTAHAYKGSLWHDQNNESCSQDASKVMLTRGVLYSWVGVMQDYDQNCSDGATGFYNLENSDDFTDAELVEENDPSQGFYIGG